MTKKLFSLKVTFHLSLRPIDIILIKKNTNILYILQMTDTAILCLLGKKKRTRAIYRIIVIGNTCMLI